MEKLRAKTHYQSTNGGVGIPGYATKKILNRLLEMLKLFSATVQQEKSLLQEAYEQNDIVNTRKLLHKIKGGLAYCHLPQLQATVEALHEQVREINQLASIEHLYNDFHQAIENFVAKLAEISG